MAYRHVVLFRIHDEISHSEVEEALSALRALGDEMDVTAWTVELSLDSRKGRIIVEDATFADDAAFQSFRTHPAHIAIADLMLRISDWWIGDYHADDN